MLKKTETVENKLSPIRFRPKSFGGTDDSDFVMCMVVQFVLCGLRCWNYDLWYWKSWYVVIKIAFETTKPWIVSFIFGINDVWYWDCNLWWFVLWSLVLKLKFTILKLMFCIIKIYDLWHSYRRNLRFHHLRYLEGAARGSWLIL